MIRVCGQCGSRNDSKRVICQNCGVRLPDPEHDGGKPVTPSAAYQPPPPVFKSSKTKYAALKTVRPRHTGRNVFLLCLMCVVGVMAWLASKAIEPVSGVKPPTVLNDSVVAHVAESLTKSAAFGRGNWVGEESSLNQVLASQEVPRLLFRFAGTAVRFQRCYIKLGTGMLDLVMLLEVAGRTVVCRLELAPVVEGAGMGVRFTGASIGTITIPEFAVGYFAALWRPCLAVDPSFIDKIASAKNIEVIPRAVILKWSDSSL